MDDLPLKGFLPLCILAVLRNRADRGSAVDGDGRRFLTQTQIEEFVRQDFDLKVARKTIAENLSRLHAVGEACPDLGFTLESLTKKRRMDPRRMAEGGAGCSPIQIVHVGWRLAERGDFETSEIRMLVDTVIASPMIPPKQMKQLVGRLARLSPDVIVPPKATREDHAPAVNSQFFLNIELLNEAIQQKRRVSFHMGALDKSAKLRTKTFSSGEPRLYEVLPRELLVSKGNYYLLATFADSKEVCKFRIDRMLDVQIMEDAPAPAGGLGDLNVLKYREQHSYMMSGKVMTVVLRVGKESLHIIFDQFGPNGHFFNEMDETIDVELRSAFYSVLFWALQYYRFVEVVSPPELRDELARAARTIGAMYEGEPGTLNLAARQ